MVVDEWVPPTQKQATSIHRTHRRWIAASARGVWPAGLSSWTEAVQEAAEVVGVRPQFRRSVAVVAAGLAAGARADGSTAPGLEGLIADSGLGRSTVKRVLGWLVRVGLLTVLEEGGVEWTSQGEMVAGSRRRRVWTMTVPAAAPQRYRAPQGSGQRDPGQPPQHDQVRGAVDETGPPKDFSPHLDESPHAGARERSASCARGVSRRRARRMARTVRDAAVVAAGSVDVSGPVSCSGVARLRAAAAVVERVVELRGASVRGVRAVLRPFLDRGWSVRDLVEAITGDRDGRVRWQQAAVRCPIGWLRHRLAPWADQVQGPVTARERAEDDRRAVAARQRAAARQVAQQAAADRKRHGVGYGGAWCREAMTTSEVRPSVVVGRVEPTAGGRLVRAAARAGSGSAADASRPSGRGGVSPAVPLVVRSPRTAAVLAAGRRSGVLAGA